MSGRRTREVERESPNQCPRQQSRMNDTPNVERARSASRTRVAASAQQEAAREEKQNVQGNAIPTQAPASAPAPAAHPSAPQQGFYPADPSVIQQLVLMIQQQNLQSQVQLQTFMQQSQVQFNQISNRQGPGRKKDPPTYDGKLNEDLELFIFSTEDYYAYKPDVMNANSSEFVEEITCNLG